MHMTSLLKSSMNGSSDSSSEAISEGARRATGETAPEEAARRDPEVVAIARRPVLRERQAPVARRGRALQGGRYARCVPASRAHLLLDDHELAQAARRGRSSCARAKKAGAEAGSLGPTNPRAAPRQCPPAPQARAR